MKIYIASVEEKKSGMKNGRKWTLYNVVDQHGTRYTTFEAKYQALVGQEVEVEIKEEKVEKNGKTYTNRTIIEPKRSGANLQLNRIEEKLNKVLKLLEEATLDEDVPSGLPPMHEPPKEDEDLPF